MAQPTDEPRSTGTSAESSASPTEQPSTPPGPAGRPAPRKPFNLEEFSKLSKEEKKAAIAELTRRADEAEASSKAAWEKAKKTWPARPRKLRDWET